MGKSLYISEKPSVAQEFAKALKSNFRKSDGYMESEDSIVTWCVGHLVTMSYPESYDTALKKWSLETIPFLPKEYKYEIIPAVKKQFQIVRGLLNRADVDKIYVCTDSGREGEYIYRLVDQMAQVPKGKEKRRVWIDSQTEEEILRGIREAKPLTAYDNLSASAYLRAQEDYLMGINFSRVLSLKYGYTVNQFLKNEKHAAIAVGRVMTCVLGMVVRREREIREFVKTPFYRIVMTVDADESSEHKFDAEFKAVEGSKYYLSPQLYKENGFKEKEDAMTAIDYCTEGNMTCANLEQVQYLKDPSCLNPLTAEIVSMEKKKENKNPPLLFNLAELQNECSKLFKISPDETLKFAQELYEKKLVTYPRTDARVLSTAVAKEIHKNIAGIGNLSQFKPFTDEIMSQGTYKNIAKTRYVNDKQITDHYAIIPTGQGLAALSSLSETGKRIFVAIVKRFLSIFYPPAVYQKVAITTKVKTEFFFSNFRVLMEEGYYKITGYKGITQEPSKGKVQEVDEGRSQNKEAENESNEEEKELGLDFFETIKKLKKGMLLNIQSLQIKEGETAPPKRYNSGSLILAMENAGQLIEDEELRAQIKGSGIGTSATRAEILNKLVKIDYLNLNKKTQIMTPSLMGEVVYDVVNASIKSLLNAELTASWEKGLTMVADGKITKEEYVQKLEGFVARMTQGVKAMNNANMLIPYFQNSAKNYKK